MGPYGPQPGPGPNPDRAERLGAAEALATLAIRASFVIPAMEKCVEDEDSVESPDDEAFIDIDGSSEEDEISDEEQFGIGANGDETGRNMAFQAFERIEKSIVDAYNLLSADEDRELFYDYLLTNLKLYFDKFEDELANVLPEPTTAEYENEKDSQEADNEAGEEAASDEGGDSLDLEDDAEGGDELEL